jgi:hypothetical protein
MDHNGVLLRMDPRLVKDGHGGSDGLKGKEITVLNRDPHHMHVYGW